MDPDGITKLPTGTSRTGTSDSETASNSPNILESPIVQVNALGGQKLQIHVVCQKQPGLLQNLVAGLEQSGLLLLQAEISAYNHVNLDAVGVQETGDVMDTVALKSMLMNIIKNVDQPSNNVTSIPSRE